MTPNPFRSTDAFRGTFAAGLECLLEDELSLGPYILVLANAIFDPHIHERLAHVLARRYSELAEFCRCSFAAGSEPDEPEDDLSVFLRLMAIGFDRIDQVRRHRLAPWEIQFNQLRSLRPRRAAGWGPVGIRAPFDSSGFHFNKPFLRRETLWSGRLAGVDLDLLFNKFPFVDLHALLVPERECCESQYLTPERHRQIWELADGLGSPLPGVGFGYNSYGAYASVNHLHFQMFLRDRPLPLALERWRHNGGPDPYPACCERYLDADEAWERIADFHGKQVSYNLVYFPGRVFCLPRRRQQTYALPPWCRGQAWYEMAGGVVAFNTEDFGSVAAADVEASLAATAEGVCTR